MAKIRYVDHTFNAANRTLIRQAEEICESYNAQGFVLTLRQLYYQLVSRDIIPNRDKEYKHLGQVINDARLAGLIDWTHLEDRTRNVRQVSSWSNPASIIESAARSYHEDLWRNQQFRPEVWIEKDALVGVIAGVCDQLDVPYFSCRGYTSQSEMWSAAMRFVQRRREGHTPIIFHLGDHDPSGLDMSRDIEDRIRMFLGRHLGAALDEEDFQFARIALTEDQIALYNPPPNPAKVTDVRFAAYEAEHGDESWELDALEPPVLVDLIETAIASIRGDAQFDEDTEAMERRRETLQAVSRRWSEVEELVR